MKRLALILSGLVFIITLLSFGCFNPHGGDAGICDKISLIYAPVILLVRYIDLPHTNIFLLMGLAGVLWSLLVGTVLAAVWKLLRPAKNQSGS